MNGGKEVVGRINFGRPKWIGPYPPPPPEDPRPAVDPDAEIEVCRVLLVKAQAAMQLALSGATCRGQGDQRMREIERDIRTCWIDVVALQKGRREERES